MDPVTGAALITTGGKLLEGLFSPSVKKQLKWQRESDQKMADWQAGRLGAIKPQQPYFQSGNLPQLAPAAYNAVMGNLMQRMGPEMLTKWGISAAPQAAAPTRVVPQNIPTRGPVFFGRDKLLQQYGV